MFTNIEKNDGNYSVGSLLQQWYPTATTIRGWNDLSQSQGWGWLDFGCRQIYEPTVSASPEGGLVSWELFSTIEDNADKFTFGSHPLLLVKSNIARDGGVYSMVTTYCDLWQMSMPCIDTETGWHTFCPGWNCVPRWRTIMLPGITYWSGPVNKKHTHEKLPYPRISSSQDVFRESHRDCERYLPHVLLRCGRHLDRKREGHWGWLEQKRLT